jgi:diadenosine tetraphosphatase ApaH/serine/threonine PP2A family protein phosphatase
MRVAVISDVHGNLHALEAVLAEVDDARPDELWCLGDTVGYGPRPNECCELVRARAELCLVGNHDLVVVGTLDLSEFNDEAAAAASWTARVLTKDARAFLLALEPSASADGVDLFHGSPRDPVWDYVLTEAAAAATFELTAAPIVLVGHSHVALAITEDGGRLEGGAAPGGRELDFGSGRWLLNPGSVGQPRDGDPRAAWLLLDLDARSARFHRVPYPIEETQRELHEAGLPPLLAARLGHGQ